jgi:hypothetical protein
MAELDQTNADCHVYTFKDGLLSAVAHDLALRVTRWSVKTAPRDDGALDIAASFDASSLVVESVMRDGRPAAGVLGPKDLDKIAKTVREEVLVSARHPSITWRGVGRRDGEAHAVIDGELTLCGRTRKVGGRLQLTGGESGAWVLELVIHQPDYGIKPYSAMLGTLKIKPDVKVRIRIPNDKLATEAVRA